MKLPPAHPQQLEPNSKHIVATAPRYSCLGTNLGLAQKSDKRRNSLSGTLTRAILAFAVATVCLDRPVQAVDQQGAEKTKRPVSASVEPAGGKEDWIGNVVVTYADGTKDRWTTKGNTTQPKVSADGTVGWVIVEPPKGSDNFSYKLRPSREIVFCHQGKIIGRIRSAKAFIQEWRFVEGQILHCAVMSRQSHGPAKIELIVVQTGQVVHAVDAFIEQEKLPPWARGFGI
jgi:hypothetical protein